MLEGRKNVQKSFLSPIVFMYGGCKGVDGAVIAVPCFDFKLTARVQPLTMIRINLCMVII